MNKEKMLELSQRLETWVVGETPLSLPRLRGEPATSLKKIIGFLKEGDYFRAMREAENTHHMWTNQWDGCPEVWKILKDAFGFHSLGKDGVSVGW